MVIQGHGLFLKKGVVMSRLKDLNTPVFWVEGHPGRLDRASWKIEVTGLCDHPRIITWTDLMAMRKSVADARLTSVTRFSVRGLWGGVRISDLMAATGVRPEARFLRFRSVGLVYDTSVPRDVASAERTLLAWEFDGEYLEEDYGGPVRVFCPYLWGYKSAKSVVAITVQDHSTPGYWERLGYPDEGQIKRRRILDVNSGRLRRIGDGEVVDFLD